VEKQFILEEIRRCADENGGVPLGRERFEAATGIRESVWSGKYWIRWNDALADAGFGPNKLNPAHDDEYMLRHLALLTRDLGHFPVTNELRMRRREDASFPSFKTFDRFGDKQSKIARLAAYCEAHPEFADVADICAPLVSFASATNDESPAAPDGFVYLIQHGTRREYKVGATNDLSRRSREIGLELPERHHVVHSFRTDDPFGIEAYWHARFKDRLMNGEWYALTKADVQAFKRRRKFM
jgi:hypothetical protein